MAWHFARLSYGVRHLGERSPVQLPHVNRQCFMRKEHRCGKMFGASKSCFIASPTEEDLEPILELMSEKLTKVGIEPIVAVKERAYGQDIFCTKICGKIIESRFCIVILDDQIQGDVNIPNPNVYYEYGLMTALRKHIIPLQKEGLDLAFNIQSYDTVKYNAKNLGSELDRAIKDAIRLTDATRKQDKNLVLSEKQLFRRLEMAGFEHKDHHWFLSDAVSDTLFEGFGHAEKKFYVYLAKIDEETELNDSLDDLDVLCYRTEREAGDLSSQLETLEESMRQLEKGSTSSENSVGSSVITFSSLEVPFLENRLDQTRNIALDVQSKLAQMETIFVGFIIQPELALNGFQDRVAQVIGKYKRYKVAITTSNEIAFGDIQVKLAVRED